MALCRPPNTRHLHLRRQSVSHVKGENSRVGGAGVGVAASLRRYVLLSEHGHFTAYEVARVSLDGDVPVLATDTQPDNKVRHAAH